MDDNKASIRGQQIYLEAPVAVRKRHSSEALESPLSKNPRLASANDGEHPMPEQVPVGRMVIMIQQRQPVPDAEFDADQLVTPKSGKEAHAQEQPALEPDDGPQGDDGMEDAQSRREIARQDHVDKQVQVGWRVNSTTRVRTGHTSRRKWCCWCKKHARVKGFECKRCGHLILDCDDCEARRTMGPIEELFQQGGNEY